MNFDRIVNRINSNSLKWDKYPNDVIPLWIADMDFEVAEPIKRKLIDIANHGVIGYSNPPKTLLTTLVNRMRERHNWDIKSEWIIILPGLVPGLHASNRIFDENSYEVMMSTPVYRPFLEASGSGNGHTVKIPFVWQNDRWIMDFKTMEKSITKDTRMYMLCNPHNPNGRVFSKDELQQLADFCVKHDLILCSDEIHCDLILNDAKPHISVASLNPEIEARTITLLAPSKTFNIAGLGCSFAIIPNDDIRARFKKAIYGIMPHPSAFAMEAAHVAYAECEEWRAAVVGYLKSNHKFLLDEINQIKGLKMNPLDATYLAWVNYEETNIPEFVNFLESKGLGVQDASIFGGDGFFRLNFATQRPILEDAINRIKNALA